MVALSREERIRKLAKEFNGKRRLCIVLGLPENHQAKGLYRWINYEWADALSDLALELNVSHLERKVKKHYHFERKYAKEGYGGKKTEANT